LHRLRYAARAGGLALLRVRAVLLYEHSAGKRKRVGWDLSHGEQFFADSLDRSRDCGAGGRRICDRSSPTPVEGRRVAGLPHSRMDGFVKAAMQSRFTAPCAVNPYQKACHDFVGPDHQPDVMSYFDRSNIPNYWAYADNFVLQDRMFESVDSYTLPSHLYLMS